MSIMFLRLRNFSPPCALKAARASSAGDIAAVTMGSLPAFAVAAAGALEDGDAALVLSGAFASCALTFEAAAVRSMSESAAAGSAMRGNVNFIIDTSFAGRRRRVGRGEFAPGDCTQIRVAGKGNSRRVARETYVSAP